jgi:16S rRNA (guanine966-N2)-methyltransferase
MRIVSGTFKGQKINTPTGFDVRPTTDRIREAVFNILEHGIEEFTLSDIRAIDLFAGTGALGLEALSRGARFTLFVEENARTRGLIRGNVETLGATGKSKIFRRDATNLGEIGRIEPFGLALLDPPYGKGLGEKGLSALHKGGWLHKDAIIVMEEEKKSEIDLPQSFEEIMTRIYGNTKITFARYKT